MATYIGEIILLGCSFAPSGWAFCNGQLLPIAENETLFNLIGTTYGGDGVSTFALPDLRGRVPIHQGTGSGGAFYFLGESGGEEAHTLPATQIPAHTHVIDLASMTVTARCRNGAADQTSPVGAVLAVESTGPYTDATLTVASTFVKAAHITELRSRIDSARAAHGLSAFAYTDPALTATSTVVRAQHILDLRTALSQVYTQLGQPQPVYTDPSLGAGTTLKAAHVSELRTAAAAVGASGTAAAYSNAAADANMIGSAIAVSGSPSAANTGGSQPHNNMQPFLTLNYCISLFGVFPPQS
jgi:microcystin-dependent protein